MHTIKNTVFTEWAAQHARTMVRLTDKNGLEIVCLLDGAISQFIDAGFKSRQQSWHEALCEYANKHNLIAGE